MLVLQRLTIVHVAPQRCTLFSLGGAKVLLFFDICKYFNEKKCKKNDNIFIIYYEKISKFFTKFICARAFLCVYLHPKLCAFMRRTLKETHVCEYCGATFKARKGAKYCSDSCRVLAANARKAQPKAVAQPEPVLKAPVKPIFSPSERKTAPIGTISHGQKEMTADEARAQLKSFLVQAGIFAAVTYLFDIKWK